MKGTLYGIGVGPGDPRLMTYLAVDTIKRCPVIAVPADGKGKAVAYKIASGIVEDLDAKECLNLSTPMTKDKAILDAAYQTAADTIIEQLEQGKDVACLTLGDPTIYSTYIYIHRLVKAKGYETEIVNGIPSFCAVSAKLVDSRVDRSEASVNQSTDESSFQDADRKRNTQAQQLERCHDRELWNARGTHLSRCG